MEQQNDQPGKWQAATAWLNRAYDEHLKRYHGWNQHLYRFWFRLSATLIIVLVLVPAGWFVRSDYRHFAEKHNAGQAQRFLEQGDYHNAVLSARASLQFNPGNVEACRIMARIAYRTRSPQVLDWQARVVAAEPTLINKLDLAEEGLIYQKPPFPLTAKILNELSAIAMNNPRYQVVAADLATSLHFPEQAETHWEAATRLDPTNEIYVFKLTALRFAMDNEPKREQARKVLENFETNDTLGLAALRLLVQERLATKDFTNANHYSTQLLARPGATLADQLQDLAILQHLNSASFSARLQVLQQRVTTDPLAVGQVSEWMQTHRELTENLQWLTNLPAEIQVRQPVELALAQGYLDTKNWKALRDFTAQGNWGGLEYLRLALVSQAFFKLGDTQTAKNNWDAAVSEAGRNLDSLTHLYHLAEQWQSQEEQKELLQLIVAGSPQERWAWEALSRIYFTTGNTAALYQIYDQMAGLFPGETPYKNNAATTALLLQTNLSQALKWAEEIHVLNPDNPDEATTYAYALHLQGHDQEGLAVLQTFQPAQLKQPSVALYYGILLVAAGKPGDATPWLSIAQTRGHMLPEEKQLLAAALAESSKIPVK